jgi:DNA primase small subunit
MTVPPAVVGRMDARTRDYLRGRFGDFYRRQSLDLPPAAAEREWGWIPFSGGGTTMVRHRSLFDVGNPGGFLRSERPRHVYLSAGRYDDPGAGSMDAKGWREADLVFDLDADHLPGVDPERDSVAEMLAACKEALWRLLDLLERDFGFERTQVVFSGGRGYHVHVRDDGVRVLDGPARREVVDYLIAEDVAYEDVQRSVVSGTATKRVLAADGGWGRRAHERLASLLGTVRDAEEPAAMERLTGFEGIGDTRAERVYRAAVDRFDAIREGDVEVGGPGMRTLARACLERAIREDRAPVDEPVTTDINRLIRLPGSLHGGTGLVVRRLDRDEITGFDPLSDAIAEPFRDHRIRIETGAERTLAFGGETLTIDRGVTTVQEPVGIFLMAQGKATKAAE